MKYAYHRTCLALLLALAADLARAQGTGEDKRPTPAEQYKALVKEYQFAASGGGGSDEERKQIIARVDKLRDGLARRFLELAANNPADPIALEALMQAVWMVNHNAFPAGGQDSPGLKAMSVLLRDHTQSDKLGPICLRISSGFRGEYETFLRTILDKNPHKSVQALACLALAQFLNDRQQRLAQIQEQSDLVPEYERLFGKEYLDDLQRRDRAQGAKEIEALFERARTEYATEKIPYEGTVGAKAKAELFEFRYLRVGKIAPDIEGEDQDGRRFKLSDYRGRVVLLDFWNQY